MANISTGWPVNNSGLTDSDLELLPPRMSIEQKSFPYQSNLEASYVNFFFDHANKGRFCNNSEIQTLIAKRLSVENKAKLSPLTTHKGRFCNN